MKRELKADSACQDLPSKISGFKTDPDEKGTERSRQKATSTGLPRFKTDPDEKGTERKISPFFPPKNARFKTDPDEKGTESC